MIINYYYKRITNYYDHKRGNDYKLPHVAKGRLRFDH